MKICAISFHSCPFSLLGGDGTGGMNVYLREICSATKRFPEVKIDVFTRIQNPEIGGIKYFSPKARVIHLKGGPERPIDRTQLYGFLPEFYENLESFIFQERGSYDLVYTHYWLSGLVGEWLKLRFNIPFVHIYHTLAFLKERVLPKNGEHKNRMRVEQHLARISDAVICSSGHEKSSLVDEYNIPSSKVRVIYPGVNEKIFFPIKSQEVYEEMPSKENDRILLFVGRIDSVKGLMTVIEALELLKQTEPSLYEHLKLIVIGGGRKTVDLPRNKEFMRIKNSIRKKNLAGKVVFLGSKKQNELKRYYSTADVLVFPSLYESFGLVAVEALACGTPVIASEIGEMTSIIEEGKNGYFLRPNNPSSLAHILKYFDSHEERLWEREKIHQNIAKNFSWEKTAQETYCFFSEVIRKKTFLTTISQLGESPPPA